MDLLSLEKQVASKATKALSAALKRAIEQTTSSKTGLARKSASSRSVFKHERLQRIVIKAPHYIFKQHYGFEGSKKNGVNMRLKATDVINKAIDSTSGLSTLADEITDIRGEQVASVIKFNTSQNGR